MKPTHPVELLACAIATQEGWFTPGTIPSILMNPGDLQFAGQIGAYEPLRPDRGSRLPHSKALDWV